MKNKFLLGAVAGVSALIVAVPLIAQFSSAQSASTSAASTSAPSQACIQALVAKDDAFLANIDAETAARRSAMQAHETALKASAGITDGARRQAAFQQANEALRTAMQNAKQSESNEKTARDTVKAACGNLKGMMFGMGWEGHRRHRKDDANEANEQGEQQDKNDANEVNEKRGQPDQNEQDEGAQNSVNTQAPSAQQ